jgi:hypothetical protein
MNLAEYIAQPAVPGETGLALQPFLDVQVYFNRPPEGGSTPLKSRDEIDWPLEAKRIGEQVMLVFYTVPTHARLQAPYANLPLRECLQISFDFPGADAIALVNPDMSWKAFRKEDLEKLIGPQTSGYR